MYTFNAEKSGDKIIITTNTYWSCNVYGNFKLTKYSGTGNDVINIIIPKEMPDAYGDVIFSYGDDRCKYPSLKIFMVNDCYIETEPMYNYCSVFIDDETCGDGKKVANFMPGGNIIKLSYKEEGEALSIKVHSNGQWMVNGSDVFVNGDELLISARTGTIEIIPKAGCSNKIKVIMRKYEAE